MDDSLDAKIRQGIDSIFLSIYQVLWKYMLYPYDWDYILENKKEVKKVLDDFERWNFYLFYVVEDKSKIDRSLKYKIEHDTVSSRKIIINREEFAGGNYDALIASYIKYDIGELVDEEHKLDFIINKSAQKLTKNED